MIIKKIVTSKNVDISHKLEELSHKKFVCKNIESTKPIKKYDTDKYYYINNNDNDKKKLIFDYSEYYYEEIVDNNTFNNVRKNKIDKQDKYYVAKHSKFKF